MIGNQTMTILADWARETKMSISSQKSKLVIIKSNKAARPPVKKYRYLWIMKVEAAT